MKSLYDNLLIKKEAYLGSQPLEFVKTLDEVIITVSEPGVKDLLTFFAINEDEKYVTYSHV